MITFHGFDKGAGGGVPDSNGLVVGTAEDAVALELKGANQVVVGSPLFEAVQLHASGSCFKQCPLCMKQRIPRNNTYHPDYYH